MRIHYIQHLPFETPGYILEWAAARSYEVTATHLYRADCFPAIDSFDLLVVMGGSMGVYDDGQFPWLVEEKKFLRMVIENNKMMLGICLGAQLIASVLGAQVAKNVHREIGWFPVYRTPHAAATPFGNTIPDGEIFFHWHGDTFAIPDGAVHLARSEACESQAFIWRDCVVGLQFHPEVTVQGIQDLVEACHNEIDGSRWVQSKEEIFDTSPVTRLHEITGKMMEYFASRV